MSNSYGRFRTNYFRVTDVKKFKEIIEKCVTLTRERIELFEENKDGEILYGFGATSQLEGYYYEETDEYSFNDFSKDLQKLVKPGDAIIIMEIGYQKLCYVSGTAFIITSDKTENIDLTHLAAQKAAEILGNSEYQTQMEY